VNQKLPVGWVWPADQVCKESRTFSNFGDELIAKMAKDPLAIHFHQWSILEEDFKAIDSLNSFYKCLSVNQTEAGVRYVTSMEAYRYPFYSVIYHPEYQMFMTPGPDTLAIATNLSKLVAEKGRELFTAR
jgi:anthranilate/para-aminobenzoate synthase component II